MRQWVLIGSASAFLAVLIGAMGAHSLEPLMNEEATENFKTANIYHLWHSTALIIVGVLYKQDFGNRKLLNFSGYSLLIGILLFSGNLYILSVYGTNPVHLLIPIGGTFFLIGWLFVFCSIWKKKQ